MAAMATMKWQDGVAEFDCVDCHEYIISYGHVGNEPVCAICLFLRTIKDSKDRELMRIHLKGQRKPAYRYPAGDRGHGK